MVTSMAMGMMVGAIIALFCFIMGYFVGEKQALDSVDNEDVYEGSKSQQINENLSPSFTSMYETNEIERFKIVKDEMEQRKIASNLFRTKKGLLSYKKFVRE